MDGIGFCRKLSQHRPYPSPPAHATSRPAMTPIRHVNPPSNRPAWQSHPTLAHAVEVRAKAQSQNIQSGFKAKKIGQAKAESLNTQLREIHRQELAFFKKNGRHEITPEQQAQLNSLLDKSQQTINGSSSH